MTSTFEKSNTMAVDVEARTLKELNHPNIVKFIGWYTGPERCHLVMEACLGGELFDRIVKKQSYSEKEARDVITQALSAISYCHSRGYVHRDLKPENLLLTSLSDDTSLKLADFGFAARVSPELVLRNQCGTPGYVAPEILCKREYGAPVDMWSVGVICYILLGGYPPFPSKTPQTVQKIKRGQYEFHHQFWKDISNSAKSFISAMLTVNPEKRITAEAALRHPWMKKLSSLIMKPLDLKKLRLFNARRKLISCISSIVAAQRLQKFVTQRNIAEHYKFGKVLGTGAFAVVKDAISLKSPAEHEQVAIKCYQRNKLRKRELKGLDMEVRILHTINHPNILTLIDTFEDATYYYIVIEKAAGGELFDRIVKKRQYSEADTQTVVRTILSAINHCHEHNIVHRDLKPENLLLKYEDNDTELKIADFGFATVCSQKELLKEQCGTPAYIAPEIIQGREYNQSVDLWSLGVITFVLLGGYLPFRSKNKKTLFSLIAHGKYEFYSSCWDKISPEAKDLINKMLVVDPEKRITADEALRHPYILCPRESLVVDTKEMETNFQAFKLYNAKRKLRSSVLYYIAVNKVCRNE